MTAYRALMVADVHMSNKLPYALPTMNGQTDRLEDQLALWERIHGAANEHGVDATFILGDLFDKSLVDAVTLTDTVRAISASPVPVYILPGNHDANTIHGGRFTVEAMNYVGGGNVVCLNYPECYVARSWLKFWPLKFMPSKEARDTLWRMREQAASDPNSTHVLLLHQSIVGCTHYGWECDDGLDGDEVCDGFTHVFAGHFHRRQFFGKDRRGHYVGAPMHHRFDDEGRPATFELATFTKSGKFIITPINGGAPEFHTMRWSKGKLSRVAVRRGDYLKVVVEATHAEFNQRRPAIVRFVEQCGEKGIHAHYQHKPVYHHAHRLGEKAGGEAMSLDRAVAAYPDDDDVDTSGLDKNLLKRVGREVLEEARRAP